MQVAIKQLSDLKKKCSVIHTGCWEFKGFRNYQGYGRTRFLGKMYYCHRIAMILSRGSIPKGQCVLHKCDNPACCNPKHLFLGTKSDNTQDMIQKQRKVVLSDKDAPGCKLRPSEVLEIHRLAKEATLTQVTIADMFGVTKSTVSEIKNKRRWKETLQEAS